MVLAMLTATFPYHSSGRTIDPTPVRTSQGLLVLAIPPVERIKARGAAARHLAKEAKSICRDILCNALMRTERNAAGPEEKAAMFIRLMPFDAEAKFKRRWAYERLCGDAKKQVMHSSQVSSISRLTSVRITQASGLNQKRQQTRVTRSLKNGSSL